MHLFVVLVLPFVLNRVAPDFGSGSGKSEIRPFFPNPAKSDSGHISSWIWSDLGKMAGFQI